MSRDAAKTVSELILRQSAEQDAVLAEIREKCSKDEYDQYKQMIGRSMGAMLLEVINPLVERYPELTPRQLR